MSGTSGNPAGRPKGARDRHRRFRMAGHCDWPCEQNLGDYAIFGGPGRPKGSRNRSREERRNEADTILREFTSHHNPSIRAILRAAKAMKVKVG